MTDEQQEKGELEKKNEEIEAELREFMANQEKRVESGEKIKGKRSFKFLIFVVIAALLYTLVKMGPTILHILESAFIS